MQNDLLFIQNTSTDSTEYEEKFVNLTANKVVFVDTNNLPTTTGIGLSTQFLKADGSLDSTTYEPILPETPINPDNKYLNGNRLWSEISIGAGGYAGNVYVSNVDSDISGYKTMSYTLDSTESIRSIVVNNNTVLSETCLYDSGVGVTVIPSGLWKATFYAKVNSTIGDTTLKIQVFTKHLADGSETDLFEITSPTIENTADYSILRFEGSQTAFTVLETDRVGVRIKGSTTRTQNTTINYIIGDGRGLYITTPLQIRHSQLRDLNGDTNYLHVTSTEKSTWNNSVPYNGATTNVDLGLNYLNANTLKLDGAELLIDVFKSGSLGEASNIFYSTGTSSQPASGTINQVAGGGLLTDKYLTRWDGSKFINSGMVEVDGRFGIGTNSPSRLFQIGVVGANIPSSIKFISEGYAAAANGDKLVYFGQYAGFGEVQAYDYSIPFALPLVLQGSGGYVFVGKTTGSEALDVNGNAIADVLKSRVPTGTAPLIVASSTKVDNLNVEMLDGKKAGDFLKYDDDLIKITSLNPEVTLKQDISNEEWKIRCGIGTGVANGSFNVYNNRIGKYAISFNSDGDCIIGDKVPEYNGYSRLLVHGGSTGANIDAIGIPGNFTDQATFEAMGSDYFTEFRSAYLQYSGVTQTGTTLGHPNSNLARLVLNGDNNLIYTDQAQSIDFWSNSLEHLRIGTDYGSYFLTNVGIGADASPDVKLSIAEKTGINEIGGVMVKLTNKTGANSVRGTVVYVNPSVDSAFGVNPINGDMPFGVVYDNGVTDGSECWVVVAGIAEVLLVNSVASTRSHIAYSSGSVAGRVDTAATVPDATTHFREIGHTMESKAGGIDVLCKCVLHFN